MSSDLWLTHYFVIIYTLISEYEGNNADFQGVFSYNFISAA